MTRDEDDHGNSPARDGLGGASTPTGGSVAGARPSRREVLASAALVALPLDVAAAQAPSAATSFFDPWVEVHAANLAHNVREVARAARGVPILAVVKNNGYGLGVTTVARLLEPTREIDGFAVVKSQEAHALRDAGVKKPVLLMGPVAESELAGLAARQISPMIYTPVGEALDRAAQAVFGVTPPPMKVYSVSVVVNVRPG